MTSKMKMTSKVKTTSQNNEGYILMLLESRINIDMDLQQGFLSISGFQWNTNVGVDGRNECGGVGD